MENIDGYVIPPGRKAQSVDIPFSYEKVFRFF